MRKKFGFNTSGRAIGGFSGCSTSTKIPNRIEFERADIELNPKSCHRAALPSTTDMASIDYSPYWTV